MGVNPLNQGEASQGAHHLDIEQIGNSKTITPFREILPDLIGKRATHEQFRDC